LWFRVVCALFCITVCVITVIKMFWTYESPPSESATFFWECDRDHDTKKEQVLYIYNFLTIWLFYCPKWVILIGYYNKKQIQQAFWIEWSGHKVERLFTKIQLPLFIYCKCSSRIIVILRQNMHIGICCGAAMEEAI